MVRVRLPSTSNFPTPMHMLTFNKLLGSRLALSSSRASMAIHGRHVRKETQPCRRSTEMAIWNLATFIRVRNLATQTARTSKLHPCGSYAVRITQQKSHNHKQHLRPSFPAKQTIGRSSDTKIILSSSNSSPQPPSQAAQRSPSSPSPRSRQ